MSADSLNSKPKRIKGKISEFQLRGAQQNDKPQGQDKKYESSHKNFASFNSAQHLKAKCTNSHIQNLLATVRKLIHSKQIPRAISQITSFLNHFSNQTEQKRSPSLSKLSSSPSNQKQQDDSILDLYFSLGTCLMHQTKYAQALQAFNKIQFGNALYKQNITLLVAMCYENLQNHQKALVTLQKASAFSDSTENLFYRAKILRKTLNYHQCENILKNIFQKQPNHFETVKMLLQVYRTQKKYSKALSLIDFAILQNEDENSQQKLRSKKAEFQYFNCQFERSFKSVQFLQKKYSLKESRWNYFKGKICLKLNKKLDSIIYFNQALQINSSINFVRLALSQLIIYFLKERDFYEASNYCKRISYVTSENHQLIQNLSFLAEGLILLMKRNFKQGLKTVEKTNLSILQSVNQAQNTTFLKNLFFNAQAFALFSLGNHQQSLNSYLKMSVKQADQQYMPCFYNIKLCQGILNMLENDNEQKAIQCFEKAIDYLLRPEPYFYISVILTQKNLNYEASSQIFMKILSILESGLNVSPTAEMYFYRALVFMFLGMNVQAIDDIDKAIQISEDNIVWHFYAKGLVYFLQENYERAISQLEVALSIDEKNQKVLFQKSKCQLFQGNIEQAYSDLQTYRQLNSFQKDQRVWQLYFLLQERKFEQILEISLKDNKSQDRQIQQSIRQIKNTCNFFLGRFQESGPSGKLIMALIYQTFEQLLKLLDQALELKINVGQVSQVDLKFIKAYALFRMQRYKEAILTFEDIQHMLTGNERQWSVQQVEYKVLIVKINTILCLYAGQNYSLCQESIIILISQINQGEILDQLKQILLTFQAKSAIKQEQSGETESQKTANNEETLIVSILNDKQMLSSFLPMQTMGRLTFKLLIPFPILEVAQLRPNRQRMLEEYSFKKIENRSQAPWIKRGQFGVLFTNQIKQYSNLHLNTEEEAQNNPKQKFIDDLRLGSEVLLKLSKIHKSK